MITNTEKNSGKTPDQWIEIVQKEGFQKYGEIVKFLKENRVSPMVLRKNCLNA
jgi:hypothetical protein